MIAFLSRKYDKKQTTGHLVVFDEDEKVFDCKTIEPAWRKNQKNISCIPERTYIVSPHVSPTYGFCLKVEDVPGRSDILFHWGNYYKNTEGCILVGKMFKDIDGDGLKDIIHSKDTFLQLIKTCPEGFIMIIKSENPAE